MPTFSILRKSSLLCNKRRGLSQIMGALLMLAIVVPIGSVILFNGATEISAFNNSMANTVDFRNNGIQEDIIFEHVRFEPTSDVVEITLLNAGTVETIIDKITLVNMTNQNILYKIDSLSAFNPTPIGIKDSVQITINADLVGVLVPPQWDAETTPTSFEYKISVITSRGNFFDMVARPYNT